MAPDGIDLRSLPQLMDVNKALKIKNYIIDADGGLEKRGGLEEYLDDGGTDGIGIDVKWGDYRVYSFGKTLKAIHTTTKTKTVIKNDFVDDVTDGEAYGNYFLVASPQNKIGRVTLTLDYDAQSANFAPGLVVTGTTSGATAIILEDSDAGATGTLTLGDITGVFQNNEPITDSATGAATVDGTLAFTYTEIAAAPMARWIKIVDTRCVAGDLTPYVGNLNDSRDSIRYSNVDDGTNPPYDDWDVATSSTDGGRLNYRNAGKVNEIEAIGSGITVVFADKGKWAFRIKTIDDGAGNLVKVEEKLMYLIDAGGNAALATDDGIYYVNSQGLYLLETIASENIKYSEQEALVSTFLGNKFFDNKDLTNARIMKDYKRNMLLITMADDSESNNFVLPYNTVKKAFGTITGWTGSTFLNDDGTLYMGSANSAKIWEILKGNDDDGSDIWYEFEQEIPTGQLHTVKALEGEYIQGELSPSSTPLIKFSIFDEKGVFIDDKLELQWNYGTSDLTSVGYGDSSWGAPFGGDVDTAGVVENFAGARERIRNFQRLRINISGHDKSAHTINWFSVITREKSSIRRRNLTNVTA